MCAKVALFVLWIKEKQSIHGSTSDLYKTEKPFYFETDYELTAERESVNLADLNVAVFMQNLFGG